MSPADCAGCVFGSGVCGGAGGAADGGHKTGTTEPTGTSRQGQTRGTGGAGAAGDHGEEEGRGGKRMRGGMRAGALQAIYDVMREGTGHAYYTGPYNGCDMNNVWLLNGTGAAGRAACPRGPPGHHQPRGKTTQGPNNRRSRWQGGDTVVEHALSSTVTQLLPLCSCDVLWHVARGG